MTSHHSMPTSNLKQPFPVLVWLFVEFLLIVSYAVKPSPYRKPLFFIPIASITLWLLFFTRMNSGNTVTDQGMGFLVSVNLLFASADILLSEPQRDFPRKQNQKKDEGSKDGAEKHESNDISSAPFLTRLWWGATVWCNRRGINFAHEPSNTPPRPVNFTTFGFILHQLLWAAWYYTVMDFGTFGLQVYADARRTHGPHLGLWRLTSVSWFFHMYGLDQYLYQVISAFSVLFHLAKPVDWPPLFAGPEEGYTLRTFWGKFWHPIFRRVFTIHADYLTQSLPKSKLATYIRLFITFIISGLIHFAGDAFTPLRLSQSGAIKFFLLQATGIMAEDALLGALRMLGVKPTHSATRKALRIAGYVWAFIWFGMTSPVWIDPLLDIGYAKEIAGDALSPVNGVLKGKWWWNRSG